MKILIIHTAFIGDIILSTPFIKSLKLNYPDYEIHYLTTYSGREVLKNNPNIEKIFVYDKRDKDKGIKGFFKIINLIRKEEFDKAYIFHRYIKSNLISFLSGIKQRIGYNISSGSFLLTKKIKYQKNIHEVERLLNFELFEKKYKMIDLYSSEDDKKWGYNLWSDHNLNEKQVIVIAPLSKWKTKTWPKENFNELLKKFSTNKNIKVILIGSQQDKGVKFDLYENTLDLRGGTTILQLYEIMARADILIGNDSAPLHVGAATYISIVAIFGATSPSLGFYPWSKNTKILENNNLKCRPCGIHGGNLCPKNNFLCMKDIKVEDVYKCCLKLF